MAKPKTPAGRDRKGTGTNPRRAFLERAGLVATALLVEGTRGVNAAAHTQPQKPVAADKESVGRLLGLTERQQQRLSPRARQLTGADLRAIAALDFERSPGAAQITVGDLKSLSEVLARSFGRQPATMRMAVICKRIPPFCCCCCCCAAA